MNGPDILQNELSEEMEMPKSEIPQFQVNNLRPNWFIFKNFDVSLTQWFIRYIIFYKKSNERTKIMAGQKTSKSVVYSNASLWEVVCQSYPLANPIQVGGVELRNFAGTARIVFQSFSKTSSREGKWSR